MKLLDCFPMLFVFEYCCCMLGWLWSFCSLLQEIVPSQLIWSLQKLKDEMIILLTHAFWLSIFLLHAWVIWIGCHRSCTALNLIDEITSDCQWSQLLSLVLVLVSAGQRVNFCSRSCSDLLLGNKLNTFFVSDWEWSQPLSLVLVLVLAGQRVNIWSRSYSYLVTPVFPKKTECISYVCQDHNFTHMINSWV
jgi:hypothetical protein